MTWHSTILLIAGLMIGGCSPSKPQATATGDQGKKLTLAVSPRIEVAQGDSAEFSLTVTRDEIKGPTTIQFKNLPDGLTVSESKLTLNEDDRQKILSIRAVGDAKPVKAHKIHVTAQSGDLTAEAVLTVTIKQSLKNALVRKQKFEKSVKARLAKVDQEIHAAETQARTLPEAEKGKALKELGNVLKALGKTMNEFERLQAASIEKWEEAKHDLESTMDNLEAAARRLQENIKGLQKDE